MKIKKNDLFMGIYLLSAVLFFIISIPSWLLDILLAFNIGVAMVVLFNALFAKEVLDMASFPTLLLFTTIFRISLNVSSTKLILRDGDAGEVVNTFGFQTNWLGLHCPLKLGSMQLPFFSFQPSSALGLGVHIYLS